ncbi:LOW QUALITY PROTEIN: hypothetical protein HMPREF0513_00067, partial [Limosilactobacillus fermentum 28-3-CHN]
LNADLAEIHPVTPYTSADLNWHDNKSRTSIEQHEHNRRVDMVDDFPDLSQYENILIGHPIWWGIPLRMIASVIDDLNLNGKTLTGFATSGGSTYGRSQSYFARTIEQNGYDVTLNQGTILSNKDGQIATWLKSLTLK